ncbi:TRAP transporter large permease [Pseudorhodoplanes sp.]|uniref:TRAP transporter large permease n=1 Tax=Pseudorhodoplanes sp. TaxID=1934341 RepID=UPI003919DA2C
MSTDAVAVIGFVSLFVAMLLRVPIGIAMGTVGVLGFGYLADMGPALRILAQSPIRTATDLGFGVVPLFLLMGAFATASGMSRELYAVAHAFLGHFRGGLGTATIAASAGFAAISGSSVASAATFANVAYPEMRRYGYPATFATGVIAAGGTLGIMIPPSVVLAVYGIITEQDIGKLFIAGIVPGIIATSMYVLCVMFLAARNPEAFPLAPKASWPERLASLRGVWAILLLFFFVIGGIYGGAFTPTEAAGMGAGGAFLISLLRGRLTLALTIKCLVDTVRTSAAVFTILIGAMIFGYFLTITQTPQKVTDFITHLGLAPYVVLLLVMLMYLLLGCILDAMAMIILTIPIIFPAMMELGFDPIWFGVIIVMTVELGLITPPIGMNVYVINSVLKDVNLSTIFYGVTPFIITDVIRLAILVSFPILSTFLPSQM